MHGVDLPMTTSVTTRQDGLKRVRASCLLFAVVGNHHQGCITCCVCVHVILKGLECSCLIIYASRQGCVREHKMTIPAGILR